MGGTICSKGLFMTQRRSVFCRIGGVPLPIAPSSGLGPTPHGRCPWMCEHTSSGDRSGLCGTRCIHTCGHGGDGISALDVADIKLGVASVVHHCVAHLPPHCMLFTSQASVPKSEEDKDDSKKGKRARPNRKTRQRHWKKGSTGSGMPLGQ